MSDNILRMIYLEDNLTRMESRLREKVAESLHAYKVSQSIVDEVIEILRRAYIYPNSMSEVYYYEALDNTVLYLKSEGIDDIIIYVVSDVIISELIVYQKTIRDLKLLKKC